MNVPFPNLSAVRVTTARHGRRHLHQRGDRPPGPPDAPVLQLQREGEEKRDHGGLEPLVNEDRSDDGNHHQQIHVRSKSSSGGQRAGSDVTNAGEDRQQVQSHDQRRQDVTRSGLADMQGVKEVAVQPPMRQEPGQGEER